MKEIIFEVREDDIDDGYFASVPGEGIHTEANTVEDLRRNLRDALECHYGNSADIPKIVRMHSYGMLCRDSFE